MVADSQSMSDKNSVLSWLLFASWFLLPVAFYGRTEIARTNADGYFWVMGVALPFYFIVTKASLTSMFALFWGFCANRFKPLALRFHYLDLCFLVFVLSPFLSMHNGNTTILSNLESTLYLTLVWGGAYFAGRIFITSHTKLNTSAEIFIIVSLLGSPFFLIEFFTSPIFYQYLYGFHPFNDVGELRFFNFRPMLLLEDGNQLGMWYSTSALIAFGFWKFSGRRKILFLKVNYVHHYSVFILLLSQSRGAIILYAAGLSFIFLLTFVRKKASVFYCIVLLLVMAATPLVFSKQIYFFAKHTAAGQQSLQVLKSLGAGSLTWRIGSDLKNAKTLKDNFLTGAGTVNWNEGNERSWGAILLILGGYGIVGLVSWSALIFAPLFLTIKQLNLNRRKTEADHSWFALVVAFALLTNWLDAFLNSFFIVSIMVWSGSLVSINQQESSDSQIRK
jgi:hypothetical protein